MLVKILSARGNEFNRIMHAVELALIGRYAFLRYRGFTDANVHVDLAHMLVDVVIRRTKRGRLRRYSSERH